MPRMCSLATDSQDTVMKGSLSRGVGSEDLEELTTLLDLAEHCPHVIGVAMSLEVHEVHVLPGPSLGRSRFDLGQVEPARRERLEDAVEHPRLVLHGEEDGGLVPSRGPHGTTADDEEARGVVRVVLDALAQHGHVVGARGELGGYRGHRGVVLARSAAAVVEDISSMRASGRWA